MLLRALKNLLAWGTPAKSKEEVFAERVRISGPLLGLTSRLHVDYVQERIFVWEIVGEEFIVSLDLAATKLFSMPKNKVLIPRTLPGFESNEWYFNVCKK